MAREIFSYNASLLGEEADFRSPSQIILADKNFFVHKNFSREAYFFALNGMDNREHK